MGGMDTAERLANVWMKLTWLSLLTSAETGLMNRQCLIVEGKVFKIQIQTLSKISTV